MTSAISGNNGARSRPSEGRSASRIARRVGLVPAVLVAFLASVASGAPSASAASAPPPVTILTPPAGFGHGDIFVTPTSRHDQYPNGPEILGTGGTVVWFHAIPPAQVAADFRAQRYGGSQVLTWWQGTGFGGLACGTDYIYTDQFTQIATVKGGNGLCADGPRVPDHPAEHRADHHRPPRPPRT